MTGPVRLPSWRPRLSAYLTGITTRPFAYGRHDCALFVAGAVEAMTGEDRARDFRGRYGSLKQGLKLLDQAGFSDHQALLERLFEPVPTAFAQVGDIAVLLAPGVPALGVFEGQHILVLQELGLAVAPREAAIAAYRVPA